MQMEEFGMFYTSCVHTYIEKGIPWCTDGGVNLDYEDIIVIYKNFCQLSGAAGELHASQLLLSLIIDIFVHQTPVLHEYTEQDMYYTNTSI